MAETYDIYEDREPIQYTEGAKHMSDSTLSKRCR